MKTIFEKLGYTVSETKTCVFNEEIELLVILNRDKSIRYAWPANLNKALFVKFRGSKSFINILLSLGCKFIFLLGLQKLFFTKKSLYVKEKSKETELANRYSLWTLFVRKSNSIEKALLYTIINGKGSFTKVATQPHSIELIRNESMVLDLLNESRIRNFVIPNTINVGQCSVEMDDISQNGTILNEYCNIHTMALSELNELTAYLTPLNELKSWRELKEDLFQLMKLDDSRLPKNLLYMLSQMIEKTNECKPIEVCLSHGDFTAENMFEKDMKLHIFDWELSNVIKPMGFDAFHFIIQQGLLVNKSNWKTIRKEIDKKINCSTFETLSKFHKGNLEQHLQFYLVYTCVNYLKLHVEHSVNPMETNHSLKTWKEALTEMLNINQAQPELDENSVYAF